MTHDLFGNEHSSEYETYMRSPAWRKRAKAAMARAHDLCERCLRTKYTCRLEVHHKTYERLGCELDQDLEVLCPDCHKKADAERNSQTQSHHEDARLDGWATKKWGEDWILVVGYEYAEERFNEWLDKSEETD